MNRALAGFFLALISVSSSAARADQSPLPVIVAGREREVLALFAPHRLGDEVTPGHRLFNVAISPHQIHIEIRAERGANGGVRLVHPSTAPNASEQSASFSILRDESAKSGDAARAADVVILAVRQNDRKGFWTQPVPLTRPAVPEPSRARGIVIPLALTLAFVSAMLLVARRALTSRPARGPGSRSV